MVFEKTGTASDVDLIVEIQDYLGVVDALRTAGHEPSWRPELHWAAQGGSDAERPIASMDCGAEPRPSRFTV